MDGEEGRKFTSHSCIFVTSPTTPFSHYDGRDGREENLRAKKVSFLCQRKMDEFDGKGRFRLCAEGGGKRERQRGRMCFGEGLERVLDKMKCFGFNRRKGRARGEERTKPWKMEQAVFVKSTSRLVSVLGEEAI